MDYMDVSSGGLSPAQKIPLAPGYQVPFAEKVKKETGLGVLRSAGVTGPDQTLPPNLRVRHGVNRSGKALHYYFNYSSTEQSLAYPYGSGTDLLTQATVAHSQPITVKPWDVFIIEEK